MDASELIDRLRAYGDAPALVHGSIALSYAALADRIDQWSQRLLADHVSDGQAVLFDAHYDADSVALLLSLLRRGAIAVPLSPSAVVRAEQAREITRASHAYVRSEDGEWRCERFADAAAHPLYAECHGHGGLVIFTSGSTGAPKASLHRADRFLRKFVKPRPALRALLVLPFDHMAGMDSLLYALTSGGAIVRPERADADGICEAIARHRVQLLPSTPSLLNLIWLSGAMARHDLSSLQLITYGAETMPDITLKRLREALPNCRFMQKYGATEFGSPPTRSRDDGSLWFRISDGEFETKVVNGLLWVRTPTAMLGYLNAPNPIDADGWLNTGDRVEVEGEFIRVLGRESDWINVGGQKINPHQVEQVLLGAENIHDVKVSGEPNPLLGHTVCATVVLQKPEDPASVRHRLRLYCRDRLPREAIPVRIEIATDPLWNTRYKKARPIA
jgi:acyl-CoA synthetase (AMP-forming)/AMP-acid ligase II